MTGAATAAGQGRRRGVFVLAATRGALEIGGVPAASLELEACDRELPDVTVIVAGRANGEHGIVHFLKVLFLEPAMFAAVFIDRHEDLLEAEPVSLA
jgi:hypothetical protein